MRKSVPEVDDSPHVRAEPVIRSGICLVLADENGMRNGKETDESSVLKELDDLSFVGQTPGRK